MDQTCTRKAFTGYSAGSAPSYSTTATTYPCRVDEDGRVVVGADGREIFARGYVIVAQSATGGAPAFGLQDQITMPDAKTPKIVRVETMRHFRDGVDHQMVWVA
jgi:hypothetical protein